MRYDLRVLVARASAYGLTFAATADGHVRVTSLFAAAVPLAFKEEVRAHTDLILRWLTTRPAADELLAGVMQRLSDSYPIGVRLDGSAWQAADEAVTAAYWSLDLGALRAALTTYERFAAAEFAQAQAHDER